MANTLLLQAVSNIKTVDTAARRCYTLHFIIIQE
jgi:hypothetical protein